MKQFYSYMRIIYLNLQSVHLDLTVMELCQRGTCMGVYESQNKQRLLLSAYSNNTFLLVIQTYGVQNIVQLSFIIQRAQLSDTHYTFLQNINPSCNFLNQLYGTGYYYWRYFMRYT
jgi:hypothetical protein